MSYHQIRNWADDYSSNSPELITRSTGKKWTATSQKYYDTHIATTGLGLL